MRVLFLWSQPAAKSNGGEGVLDWPGVEVQSAGLSRDADTPLDSEVVEWAELIFVMEDAAPSSVGEIPLVRPCRNVEHAI